MARPPHKLKKDKLLEGVGGLRILDDVGVKVHKLKGLKLHAKLLLADNVRGIVGSINLAPGSFDSRRECAIEVRDEDVVGRLHEVTHTDWKNSHPLDLTDEGLLAELGRLDENAVEDLALDVLRTESTRSSKSGREPAFYRNSFPRRKESGSQSKRSNTEIGNACLL